MGSNNTLHDPDANVNRALAAQYRYDARAEHLAQLHDAEPDVYALLPASLRERHAEYVRVRLAAKGAGLPVGPPGLGGATLNAAIRQAAGRQAIGPQALDDQDADQLEPAEDWDAAVLAAARDAGFHDPEDALNHLAGGSGDAVARVQALARERPYLVGGPPPAGSVGQGRVGRPAPIGGENAAGNAWLRGRLDNLRDRRGMDERG